MRRFIGMGGATLVCVVVAWRGLSELLERRAELAASGQLDARVAARRRSAIDRALARAGFAPTPQRVPVYASVHVGSYHGSDVDDVGLLEGAMRRAARERMDVSATGVTRGRRRLARRPHVPMQSTIGAPVAAGPVSTKWRRALIDDDAPIEAVPEPVTIAGAPAWTVVAAAIAVVATLVPLVRPLSDVSLLLAGAGALVVAAAWLGARKR